MSVAAVVAVMFLVVSGALFFLEWLSREAPPTDEPAQRRKAPRRRR